MRGFLSCQANWKCDKRDMGDRPSKSSICEECHLPIVGQDFPKQG